LVEVKEENPMSLIRLLLLLGLVAGLQATGDAGAGIDPDGRPASYQGSGIDPNGGGSSIDPNGGCYSATTDDGSGLDPHG
jgi:hypothetical protein